MLNKTTFTVVDEYVLGDFLDVAGRSIPENNQLIIYHPLLLITAQRKRDRKNLLQGSTKNILSIAAIESGPAITQINELPY